MGDEPFLAGRVREARYSRGTMGNEAGSHSSRFPLRPQETVRSSSDRDTENGMLSKGRNQQRAASSKELSQASESPSGPRSKLYFPCLALWGQMINIEVNIKQVSK